MALFNASTNELTAKIVYYGPGLSGKTSNLAFIYENMDESERGRMLSLSTESDRTILFDFMPLEMGKARGVNVRLQLYTVPGQVFYESTRKKVLKGADGVVFVADSQRDIADANLDSLNQLKEHLLQNNIEFEDMPLVLQYNKRDLGNILSLEEMDEMLNSGNTPFFEAVATEGIGVEDSFKAISSLVLRKLFSRPLEELAGEGIAPEEEGLSEVSAEESSSLWGSEESGEELFGENSGLESTAGDLTADESPEEVFSDPDEAALVESETSFNEEGPGKDVPAFPEEVAHDTPVPDAKVEAVAQPSQLTLTPGSPFETTVEVMGKRFKLTLQIEPID